MITKKRAIEIWNRVEIPGRDQSYGMAWNDGGLALLEALDRAGAFVDEETPAEIANVARRILELEAAQQRGRHPGAAEFWRAWAVRLASACRAAGLVKP